MESCGIFPLLPFSPHHSNVCPLLIKIILSVLDFEQSMVLAACGPYTTSDSITYDPLLDLITIINHDRPDVCILVGGTSGKTGELSLEKGFNAVLNF